MNWLSLLTQIISLAPAVTQVIQIEVGDSQSGASKAQMATDALLGSAGVADAVFTKPSDQMAITLLTAATQTAINAAVATGKANGTWAKIAAATAGSLPAAAETAAGVSVIENAATINQPAPVPEVVQGGPSPALSAVKH
jgi:hypothetical protein